MFFPISNIVNMYIDNSTSIKSLIINRKSYTNPFNPVFLMLAEKSPEIFPKGYFFISESFVLN